MDCPVVVEIQEFAVPKASGAHKAPMFSISAYPREDSCNNPGVWTYSDVHLCAQSVHSEVNCPTMRRKKRPPTGSSPNRRFNHAFGELDELFSITLFRFLHCFSHTRKKAQRKSGQKVAALIFLGLQKMSVF